jgi:uncharacterized membrane protein YdjX (TVP38/TMEM64 family)
MLEAIIWTIVIIALSQVISFAIVWWLGVPPSQMEHEIEEKQNGAVGAIFFIVTLIVTIFISVLSSNGFTGAASDEAGIIWTIGGVVVGTILTFLNIFIVFRWMGQDEREAGESMYRYFQRELIDEHNLALAFFIGGLAAAPYIAILFQII